MDKMLKIFEFLQKKYKGNIHKETKPDGITYPCWMGIIKGNSIEISFQSTEKIKFEVRIDSKNLYLKIFPQINKTILEAFWDKITVSKIEIFEDKNFAKEFYIECYPKKKLLLILNKEFTQVVKNFKKLIKLKVKKGILSIIKEINSEEYLDEDLFKDLNDLLLLKDLIENHYSFNRL